MKGYLYGGLAFLVVIGLGISHSMAFKAGKNSIEQKLKDDRITILKDGKKIDENVLSADDNGLLCLMLDNCPNKPM